MIHRRDRLVHKVDPHEKCDQGDNHHRVAIESEHLMVCFHLSRYPNLTRLNHQYQSASQALQVRRRPMRQIHHRATNMNAFHD
jgi:hypothetical protein